MKYLLLGGAGVFCSSHSKIFAIKNDKNLTSFIGG